MSLVFPLPFDGDAPAIVILDADGNVLDDSLDENTYATFGTIPKGGSSTLTLYVKNTGATPIYSVKCEGIASSNQLGEAANTYEVVDLPQELGNIDPREIIELEVVWTVPLEASTGMKIFGLKVVDSTYLSISENHEKYVKITITNNDTDLLLDFPIEIDLDVDSIDWAETTSDGRDLRFYDENLNELPYYLETWTPATTTGKVWVRVPKIEGGESIDIYMGYGKFDLISISTTAAKYELYDDFDDAFANDYALVGSPSYEFSGSKLVLKGGCTTGTTDGIYFPLPTPYPKLVVEGAITTYANSSRAHTWYHTLFFENGIATTRTVGDYTLGIVSYKDSNSSEADAEIVVANVSTDVSATAGETNTFKTICNTASYTGYVNDALKGTYTIDRSFPIYLRIFTTTLSTYCGLGYIGVYKYCPTAMTITFTEVADITAEFTNPDVDSGIICVIGNVVRQLTFHDYDFKKIIYEVGYNNAYWRVPGGSGIYVWGKLEMRPLYGEDVSFVDNLYANDAYFYTFTDYTYDIHDKLDVEGVLYDIQAIQVHDAGRETIYKTLVLKRQPEYYACCVGIVS